MREKLKFETSEMQSTLGKSREGGKRSQDNRKKFQRQVKLESIQHMQKENQ